ncbi:unnamed protein product [Cylicocyclus nassatus]|uniref:SWIM-type domain-containing protein n=1 Tax=Cylicocyclus nassatus TaxID=53992 RepID=A0AA36M5J0_CYLNA|nr:unnamed protein product [Cylicocyclus nassatus]
MYVETLLSTEQNHHELARHARLSHATEEDDYAVEKVTFGSIQEYKEWRQISEEASVINRFVSTIKHGHNNVKTTYLRCSRALRSLSIVPMITRKTVAYCTAYIKVVEDGVNITVKRFTHCGHDVNPAKLRLDEKSQQYIASLLKEGATVKQVKEKLGTKMRDGPKNRLFHNIAGCKVHRPSDRIDQWAAFGRLGSHKILKHGILEGKADVRIDTLLELLIKLTTEAEEEREIAVMERGVEEGRYRLQQHHKSYSAAVTKYHGKQDLIVIAGNGHWEVEDNGRVYNIREQFCPCDSERNNHCKRGNCKACPYAFTCNCALDVRSGINCLHVHAAFTYAPLVIDSSDEEELVDLQEVEPLYVEDDEEDTVLLRRRSTDNRDKAKDALQEIEMTYAASRTKILAMSSRCSDEALQAIEVVRRRMKEGLRILAAVESQLFGEENDIRLARRAEVSSVEHPQGFTPIRKLHKRSHLWRCEAKRLKIVDIPDCAPDERDSYAICLRMQPSNSQSTTINWIQCPECEDWMHTECVGSTCPKDGTNLEGT